MQQNLLQYFEILQYFKILLLQFFENLQYFAIILQYNTIGTTPGYSMIHLMYL